MLRLCSRRRGMQSQIMRCVSASLSTSVGHAPEFTDPYAAKGKSSLEKLLHPPAIVLDRDDADLNYNSDDSDLEFDDEEDEDTENPYRNIAKEVFRLGRVPYHHIEPLPSWVQLKQEEISSHRTKNQVRRCLKTWMLKPEREKQKKFVTKPLGWWDTATTDPSKRAEVMAYGPEETIAYAHFFMPSRFAITQRVFREIKTLMPEYQPSRVMDFGCGPATGAAAAKDVWPEGVSKYCGIDVSTSMLDAAKIMTRGDKNIDAALYEKTADVVKRAAQNKAVRFDLALSSFTLSELVNDPQRRAAAQVMFELLDTNGLMVLIEVGNPIGSHAVRSGRQFILDEFNGDRPKSGTSLAARAIQYLLPPSIDSKLDQSIYQAHVISPCTHDGVCPLEQGVWCSFSQKVKSSMIRKYSEEKFSYVVIQKRLKPSFVWSGSGEIANGSDKWLQAKQEDEEDEDEDPTPLEIIQRFHAIKQDDLDLRDEVLTSLVEDIDWQRYAPPLRRAEWGRLIRSPIKNKGHVILDVCTPSGNIARTTLSKSGVVDIPYMYKSLRKINWGGLVPDTSSTHAEISPLSKKSVMPKKVVAKKAVVEEVESVRNWKEVRRQRKEQHHEESTRGRVTVEPPAERRGRRGTRAELKMADLMQMAEGDPMASELIEDMQQSGRRATKGGLRSRGEAYRRRKQGKSSEE